MPQIKEFYQSRDGDITVEYDDGSVKTFNLSNTIRSADDGSGKLVLDAASKALWADAGVRNHNPEFVSFATVGDSRAIPFLDAPANLVRSAAYWFNRYLQLCGQPGLWVYNGGVSAERTDQFAARVAIAASSSATDVILKGGVNDIGQAYPSASTSGATAAANLIKYIDILRKAGKRVWVEEEEGTDQTWPGTSWNSAMSQQANIQNGLVEAYCKTVSNVFFLKWSTVVADRTSANNKHILGTKYDGLHAAVGGGLNKAVYVYNTRGNVFGLRSNAVIPSFKTYTGDTSNPGNVLDNPGFATTTGGTLGTGAASLTAWAATQTIATTNNFRTNGGNVYFCAVAGTTGSTAPVHTSGTVSDGGMPWTFVMSATNSIPQYYQISGGGGGTYACGTNTYTDPLTGAKAVEMVVIALFSAANSTVNVITGSDTQAAFRGRQVIAGQYSLKATVVIDSHANLGFSALQWNRGDMSNPPSDGFANSNLITDNQSRYTNVSGQYPLTEHKQTQPFEAKAQVTQVAFTGTVAAGATSATLSTPWTGATTSAYGITFSDGSAKSNATLTNGSTAVTWTGGIPADVGTTAYIGSNNNFKDTVAVWNDAKVYVSAAAAGYAIFRVRDFQMIRTA